MNAVAIDSDDTIDFPPIKPALRPGIYRRADGAIFRVRMNSGRDRLYALRWVKRGDGFAFAYDRDAITTLTASDALPLDEARAISRDVGQCVVCARVLSDAKSLAAGVGPTCAKNWTRAELPGVVATTLRAIAASPKTSVRARLDGERIAITSQYDDAIVGIIKNFPGRQWNSMTSEWSMPREHAVELAEAFAAAGIAYDDVAAIAMGWKG